MKETAYEMNRFAITNPLASLKKVRDLTLLAINESQYLVVACDSDGGIGSKPDDIVKVTEEVIGAFAVRVPLFEMIASGARPVLVVDCLSVELEGTGEKIIRAIKAYASKAGLTDDIQFTGSTEENVPTTQTGIGITVLGVVDKDRFVPGTARDGDVVACAGIPKSAPHHDVRLDDPEILSIEDLLLLRQLPFVRDIVPVGSKGCMSEAEALAKTADLTFVADEASAIDLFQSGGPSTCVLFSAHPEHFPEIASRLHTPVTVIGCLLKEDEDNVED